MKTSENKRSENMNLERLKRKIAEKEEEKVVVDEDIINNAIIPYTEDNNTNGLQSADNAEKTVANMAETINLTRRDVVELLSMVDTGIRDKIVNGRLSMEDLSSLCSTVPVLLTINKDTILLENQQKNTFKID